MKRSSIVWCIVLLIIISFGMLKFYEEFTGHFNLTNISYDLPYNQAMDIPPLSTTEQQKVEQILSQPFSWLDHGHQIYAFASQDQKYVLKIFKFKRLKPAWTDQWFSEIPGFANYYELAQNKRERRFQKLFKGYRLAYTKDRENTGLLYVHLNKTDNLQRKITVKDRLGFTHSLALDDLIFAVQERGRTAKKVLTALLENHDVEGVKSRIKSLFQMYVAEYKKGLVDWDRNVMHNSGFIGVQSIRLDLGQLQYDENVKDPEIFKEDLRQIASKRLTPWLKNHYPQYEVELTLFIQQLIREL